MLIPLGKHNGTDTQISTRSKIKPENYAICSDASALCSWPLQICVLCTHNVFDIYQNIVFLSNGQLEWLSTAVHKILKSTTVIALVSIVVLI